MSESVSRIRLYQYRPDADSFAGIGIPLDDEDKILAIRGRDDSLRSDWKAPICHEFDDNPPDVGDFPSLSNYYRIPVMSQRAWSTLESLIGYCCEALPIRHPSGESYFIVHVMETIDCLNEDASEVSRNEVTGRISSIRRYAFREHLLSGKHIFKLPKKSGSDLLVDEVFRQAVQRHRLRGLIFKEIPLVSK